jgi:hypothetical protein
VGTLFKAAAVFLGVAVVGELIAGVRMEGTRMLAPLLGQLARTAVFAVVLWGGGDLVKLLIHLGNDVRAERILLSRLVHRTPPVNVDAPRQSDRESIVVEEVVLEAAPPVEVREGRRTA